MHDFNFKSFLCLLLIGLIWPITKSYTQSFAYSELASINAFDIGTLKVSPSGTMFIIGISKVIYSHDRGETWDVVEDLPGQFVAQDIYFFSDDSYVLVDYVNSKNAIIQRNNVWESVLPSGVIKRFDPSRFVVNGTMIVYEDGEGSIYISNNKGLNFNSYESTNESQFIHEIKLENQNIHIILSTDIVGQSLDSISLLSYNRDFNVIKEIDLDFLEFTYYSAYDFYHNKDLVFILNKYENQSYLSIDNGQSWLENQLPYINYNNYGIYNDVLYVYGENKVSSISLNEDFETNQSVIIDSSVLSSRFSVSNGCLIKARLNDAEVESLEDGEIIYVSEIPFMETRINKLEVYDSNTFYCNNDSYIFRSLDGGLSWENIYGNGVGRIRHFSIAFDGGLLFAQSATEILRINTDDTRHVVTLDSIMVDGYNYITPYIFEVNIDGENTLVGIGSNANTFSPGYVYTVVDGELDNFFYDLNAHNDIGYDYDVFVDNQKLFLYSHEQSLLFFEVDLENEFVKRNQFIINLNGRLEYASHISNDGSIILHPKENIDHDNGFFTTFYSDTITASDFEPTSRGPRGQLIESDSIIGTFVINRKGEHFYRRELIENYFELNVEGLSVQEVSDFAFDGSKNIILTADNGRMFKGVFDKLSSLQTVDNTELKLWPNPCFEHLQIKVANLKCTGYNIVNIQGQVVKSEQCNTRILRLNTTAFTPGVYFIRVSLADGQNFIQRFIKG